MSFVRAFLITFGYSLVCVFIQGTLLGSILPIYLVPNLVVTLVVYLAFFEPTSRGAFLVFLVGLAVDIASGSLLGPWAAAYIVVFALFASLSQRIFVESYLAAFLAVFVSALLVGPIYVGLYYGFDVPVQWTFGRAVGQGAASGVLAPFLIRFLKIVLRGELSRSSGRLK